MPYKDEATQRKAIREAVKRHRGITKGITQYPPIVYALADPIKRKKLQDICKSLDHRNLQSRLYFGAGKYSIDFEVVEQLLEVTGAKQRRDISPEA